MKHTTISVSRVRRATVEEKKDKRRGRILAFFLHTVMLALAIWPFLVELPEEKTAEVQVVMLDFRDPPPIAQTSGSSREGASAPAKSGVEYEPEPTPQTVEEVTPPTPEPEPTPVEPEPTPVEPQPIPEPIILPPTPQPELTTTKRPEPVKVPPPPPLPPKPTPEPPTPTPAPPKPKPAPPKPAPQPEPEAAPEPVKRKPISERIADLFKDSEYSGKKDEGTGAGRTPNGKEGKDGDNTSGTNGTGNTGDGDSDKGDRANGAGDGWVEGLGSLSRIKISSPPISDLVKKVGRVVVKVCINKGGTVVYKEYDTENSTLNDVGHQQRAIEHVQKIVFERNDSAPDKECGRLTFRMTRNGFEQE